MDFIDQTLEREAMLLEAQCAVRKPVQKATGFCFNCDAPVPNNACYCDKDCREDHEKEQRLRSLHPQVS